MSDYTTIKIYYNTKLDILGLGSMQWGVIAATTMVPVVNRLRHIDLDSYIEYIEIETAYNVTEDWVEIGEY
jgi:hypothetical protein